MSTPHEVGIEFIGSAPMTGEASEIAVSELSGVALDDLCNWVIIAVRHTKDGHAPVIVPRSYEELPRLLIALEHTAACIRKEIG